MKKKQEAINKKQKRMKLIVKRMKEYIDTYEKEPYYLDYGDSTFILDMIYGIGVSINPKKYKWHHGFEDFKKLLKEIF